MGRIIRFPSKEQDVVKQLEIILEKAKAGEMKRFVFAAEMAEKELPEDDRPLVATSWSKCDIGDRQYLIAHLQADVSMDLVEVRFLEE